MGDTNKKESLEQIAGADGDVSLRDLDVKEIDRTAIEGLLRSGSPGQAHEVLENLFAGVDKEHLKSTLLRQYITVDIHLAAKAFAASLGVERETFVKSCGSVDEIIKQLETIEGTKQYLANMLEQCISWRGELALQGNASVIEKAKRYIAQNFANEGMSLGVVAADVGMSAAYFSTLFKKKEGISFVDYLISVRIEKAKELLCCTGKNVSEVAALVGYSDQHYFSSLFKKHTNSTPKEFQMRKNGRKTVWY